MATTTTHYGFTKPGVNDYVDISVLNANFDNLDTVIYNNQLSAQAALDDIAPEYDATATYSVGDYVTYNKTLYKCATAITTAEAFDDTKWTAVKVGGELKSHDERISDLEAGVELEGAATNSFDDGIDSYFKKVESSIVPIQAGSGTPSPTNVRAISGFTECVVKDFGNNFMPQKDVSVPDTQTNVAINLVLPKGTYTISANISTDGSDTSFRYNIRLNNIAYANGFLDTSGGRASSTFTIDQDCNQVYLYGGASSLTQANTTYTDIQIERGSTPTAYTPYVTPTTATISFGEAGTVYGVKVGITTGLLTVAYGSVDLGSLNWVYQSDTSRFYVASPSDLKRPSANSVSINGICEVYNVRAYEVYGNYDLAVTTTGSMFVKNSDYTDATAFKTAMSGKKLVYELATPVEYQLTPAQLRSLVGANRLTSSTGEVAEVEYIKNKTIAWLLDLIRA